LICVVQNDFKDGETISQVANMDKIYAGAYLTIIAAAPEEMYEKSLVPEWPSFKKVVYIIRIPYTI
jgi:Heterokaryon incompatibility protein (HET)